MTSQYPPVHANFSDHGYAELLSHALQEHSALSGLGLLNLATADVCWEQPNSLDGTDADRLKENALGLARSLFGGSEAEKSDDGGWIRGCSEAIFAFSRDEFAICQEQLTKRHFAAVVTQGAVVDTAISRLAQLLTIDSSGDQAEVERALAEGAGAGFIVDGESVFRGGSLSAGAAAQLVNDEASLRAIAQLLFTTEEVANGAANFQQLVSAIGDSADQLCKAQWVKEGRRYAVLRIPFAPDLAVFTHCSDAISPANIERWLGGVGYDILRRIIGEILGGDIDIPDISLPPTDEAFNVIINQLRKLDPEDLYGRLILGGFANHGLGEGGEMDEGAMVYRCKECIYYLPNRKWCDLPELPLPVEAEWYCRLWKL